MKRIIRIVTILLAVLLCFSAVACTQKNGGGNNEGTEGGGKEDKTPLLLFQIDAGLGGQGLTTLYSPGDEAYDLAFENIASGLSPLKEKFEVAVLINPQHSYKAQGFTQNGASDPMDRIGESLKYALTKLTAYDIPVYLELYSSDCGTNQNGELASLPKPEIIYGDGKAIGGLTMDLSTLKALRANYPIIEGVRFHELVGSNQLGQENDPHGFKVEEGDLKQIIEELDAMGSKLVWSDHSWDYVGNPAYHDNLFFDELVKYASSIMGERLTVLFANNTFRPFAFIHNMDRNFPYRSLENSYWGLSNQSWAWQSLASSNLKTTQGGTKWFIRNEMDATPEFMAIYTQFCLDAGAKLIQYEPGYYFFNFHNTPWLTENPIETGSEQGLTAFYEEKPNFSARLSLKRMTEILLDPEGSGLDFDLTNYIDSSEQKFTDNLDIMPYKKYIQETLTAIGGGQTETFDKYSANDSWISGGENRYLDSIFEGELIDVTRARVWAGTNDDFVVLKEENGKRVAYFYNWYNGLIMKDEQIFADNENGEVVSVSGGNLLSEIVSNLAGDPDELLVCRKNAQERYIYEVYKAVNQGAAASYGIRYTYVETLQIDNSEGFSKALLLGQKRQSIKTDSSRPEDLIVLFKEEEGNLTANVSGTEYPLGSGWSLKDIEAIDITLAVASQQQSYMDEIALLCEESGKSVVKFLQFTPNYGFSQMEETVTYDLADAELLLTLRKGFYYNSLT